MKRRECERGTEWRSGKERKERKEASVTEGQRQRGRWSGKKGEERKEAERGTLTEWWSEEGGKEFDIVFGRRVEVEGAAEWKGRRGLIRIDCERGTEWRRGRWSGKGGKD